jgi:hypothetical protein
LNHWPIIGTYIGVALILVALVARSNDVKQAAHALFAFMALVAIPAYLSGNAAAEAIKELNPSMPLIESHEGTAMLAFISLEVTGIVALFALWRFSRAQEAYSAGSSTLVTVLAIVTAGLMAITGTTGGNIRHPEIVANESPSAIGAAGAGLVLSIRYFVVDYSRWIWPIVEDLHFIGLILIFASVGLLNVRVMGFLKTLPVKPLHRLLPLGILGLGINVVTGVMFFIGMPYFYVTNPYFQLKIFLILLAGGNLLLFHFTGIFRKWQGVGPGGDAPLFAKLVAASSLALWLLIVVIGRYIPVGEQ